MCDVSIFQKNNANFSPSHHLPTVPQLHIQLKMSRPNLSNLSLESCAVVLRQVALLEFLLTSKSPFPFQAPFDKGERKTGKTINI